MTSIPKSSELTEEERDTVGLGNRRYLPTRRIRCYPAAV